MDARTKHLRRLRRLRRSARWWSVRAGLLVGAAAVLVPYHGLGLPDAAWAAAAGGSVAITFWRWADLRELAAQPVPDPPTPELAAAQTRAKLVNVVRRLPAGRAAIEEFDRQRAQLRMRGLSVAEPWRRLDRAAMTLTGLAGRLGGPAAPTLVEAAAAERALRELGDRAAGVERALRVAPAGATGPLTEAHAELMAEFDDGVRAYEGFVAAAAGYIAEDGRMAGPSPAVGRLTEAADLLHGITAGLSEFRQTARP